MDTYPTVCIGEGVHRLDVGPTSPYESMCSESGSGIIRVTVLRDGVQISVTPDWSLAAQFAARRILQDIGLPVGVNRPALLSCFVHPCNALAF